MFIVAAPGWCTNGRCWLLHYFNNNNNNINNNNPMSGLILSFGLYLLWKGRCKSIWFPCYRQLSGFFLNTRDVGNTFKYEWRENMADDGDHIGREPCSLASEIFLTPHSCKVKKGRFVVAEGCFCQARLPAHSSSYSEVLWSETRYWVFHSQKAPSFCTPGQDGSNLSD